MPTPITVKIGSAILAAELDDSPGAGLLAGSLPTTIPMGRWGDEYYGNCGFDFELAENARDILEVGEIALWPPGSALCIFFGPTPASSDERPKAASAVNPVGRIIDDSAQLKALPASVSATIEKS